MSKKKELPVVEGSDIEILRFLLKIFYERDNDALAWRLIERFGNATKIFEATYEQLMQVDGVTDRVATFFTFMRPMYRQALLRSEPNIKLTSESSVVRYAAVYFMNERNPFDVCVYLDKRGKLLNASRLIEEDRRREIIGGISGYNADKLIWLRFYPYDSDRTNIQTVKRLEMIYGLLPAFDALETEFVDYIEYASFKFYDLRRALGGDEKMTPCNDASDAAYSPIENSAERLRSYIDMCVERIDANDGDNI